MESATTTSLVDATAAEPEHPCQSARTHRLIGTDPASQRVRFYCERCTRGNTPETQTDMDMCDACIVLMANVNSMVCMHEAGGCGYSGVGTDFVHPDGPATGRRPVMNGQER